MDRAIVFLFLLVLVELSMAGTYTRNRSRSRGRAPDTKRFMECGEERNEIDTYDTICCDGKAVDVGKWFLPDCCGQLGYDVLVEDCKDGILVERYGL